MCKLNSKGIQSRPHGNRSLLTKVTPQPPRPQANKLHGFKLPFLRSTFAGISIPWSLFGDVLYLEQWHIYFWHNQTANLCSSVTWNPQKMGNPYLLLHCGTFFRHVQFLSIIWSLSVLKTIFSRSWLGTSLQKHCITESYSSFLLIQFISGFYY